MRRECEAKLLMIKLIHAQAIQIDGEWGDGCLAADDAKRWESFDSIETCTDHGGEALMAGLRILASVYVDHPDYDPAWREARA